MSMPDHAAALFLLVAASSLGCPFALSDDYAVDSVSGGGGAAGGAPTTCADGQRNGLETSVDCGGGSCPPCARGGTCTAPVDCQSGVCLGGTCRKAVCDDGLHNGGETGVDCGGDCPGCPAGSPCNGGTDCKSLLCAAGSCVEPCDDGVTDSGETDVDCGGPCGACALGASCDKDHDCGAGNKCQDHACVKD